MKKWCVLFIIVLCSLVACSHDEETTNEQDQEEPEEIVEEEPVEPEEPEKPEHIYPLTGLEAEEDVTDRWSITIQKQDRKQAFLRQI